ncbi:MAG TPA: hypothetical protein VLW55_01780 [Burkholderiaceae bacterium]|nr:hypothetical protein [Burkholderiaceae bacterium]
MSNRILRHLLPVGGAMLLSLAAAMPASADVGADAYSCHVLGDSSTCEKVPAQAGADTVKQVVPGAYARYLMYLGRTTDQAIAEALAIGEQPTVRVVSRRSGRQLSSIDAYERLQGRGSL